MTVLRARVLSPRSPTEVDYLEDGVVAFENGRITDVAPWSGQVVDEDLRPHVLLPGFVDSHVHFPQARIIGSASGPLLPWLEKTTFPEEARFADREHATRVARVFAASLAAAGTTSSFVYGSVHPQACEALFEVAHDAGLRMRAGPVLMDRNCPEELQLAPEPALAALEELANNWHGAAQGRLEVAAIPRFALSCSAAMLQGAGALADRLGLWVSTHLSENPEECRIARELFATKDYLTVYERFHLVHDRSVFAHCIHLSDSEWDRFADAGAVVAHCPDSNDFLGSGGMPVAKVRMREIEVSIGSDVAGGRTYRIPSILSSAYDNSLRVGSPVSPELLLWWGTRGGALALGWAGSGALLPGLEADLVCMELPPWIEGAEAVLAAVILSKEGPLARKTWVGGELIWDRETDGSPWSRWSSPGETR